MFRRFLVVLFVFILPLRCIGNGDSLDIPGRWSLGVKIQNGFLLAHRPTLVYLQQEKINSFEISFLKSTDGEDEWERIYNAPLIGVAYQYFDLGNKEMLGSGQALYPLVVFPMLHKHHLRFNIRFGIGIGYVEKRYTISEDYKNQAISTHLNGMLTTGIQFRFPCNSKTQISAGIDFTHFSNGATRLPNAGLNIPTVNIGIQHFLGKPFKAERGNLNPYQKKREINIYVATALKEQVPGGSPKFSVAVLEADYHLRVSRKSLLGGGADLFYDQTLQKRIYEIDNVALDNPKANFRMGIHGSYGLIVGNFNGFFQMGYYLYNRLSLSVPIYHRLSLRYYVKPRVFVCFNLKSHFAKADYFEYGVGYKFK